VPQLGPEVGRGPPVRRGRAPDRSRAHRDDFYALGDRCSHEDYSLSEGEVWEDTVEIECPRHGSTFDLRDGTPCSLPATKPVRSMKSVSMPTRSRWCCLECVQRAQPPRQRGRARGAPRVDLEVRSGEVHIVMGPNGSGKSTLAHALMGRPGTTVTEGSITLDGVELVGMPSWQRARAGLFLALQQPSRCPASAWKRC